VRGWRWRIYQEQPDAIIAVPTAIAGIYGMNFKNMPELQWEYGYFTVVGFIVVACTALFWRFRRVGWL
jgi:magnesium transporter